MENMKKKKYIQPEITIELLDAETLLTPNTIPVTDTGADNGDDENSYAKKNQFTDFDLMTSSEDSPAESMDFPW